MASNSLLDSFGVWTLTYLAHSTLLLGCAWLICRGLVQRSHALRERLWKLAAVGGLITATLAVSAGWGFSVVIGTEPEAAIAGSSESQSFVFKTTSLEPSVTNDVISAEDAELLREAESRAVLLVESAEPDSSDIALLESPIESRRTGNLARRVGLRGQVDVMIDAEASSELELSSLLNSTQSAGSIAASSLVTDPHIGNCAD